MKINKILALPLVVLTFISFSACSKDDTGSGSDVQIDAAVGSYKGTLVVNNPTAKTVKDAIIVVKKINANTVNVAPKSGESYSNMFSCNLKIGSTNDLYIKLVPENGTGYFDVYPKSNANMLNLNYTANGVKYLVICNPSKL